MAAEYKNIPRASTEGTATRPAEFLSPMNEFWQKKGTHEHNHWVAAKVRLIYQPPE